MKTNEISIGGVYVAKVSGKLTQVRVDDIREINWMASGRRAKRYRVTNLRTGRVTEFWSAAKFRSPA